MINRMKKVLGLMMIVTVALCGCGEKTGAASVSDVVVIELQGDKATVNGQAVEEFDYTWHSDPSKADEWYEGNEPETDKCAYIAHDIWYYPELKESGFAKVQYDGETEWAYNYTAEGLTDYIYATLPIEGETVPTEMMHTAEEAYKNPVLHITKPGTYSLQGTWNGQIMIDLGDKDETFTDENARVKVILNGVDVNCTVAPAFIAYSAFECDNTWEDQEKHSNTVDTSNAGVNIEIADNTINNFSGTNIYRMLKPQYKKDTSTVQKKLRKIDGAFYSFVSMNINGQEKATGILNITSGFEGLDDELHLTINSGNINIYAQNDGINVNEDNVSVFTMNGGTVHIFAGLGAEGDGVDSNGYNVVNGGIIAGGTPSGADELLDSDCGNTVNGGEVITIGSSNGFGMRGGQFGGERPDFENGDFDKDDFGKGNFDRDMRPMGDGNFTPGERPDDMPGDMPNDQPGDMPNGMPEGAPQTAAPRT